MEARLLQQKTISTTSTLKEDIIHTITIQVALPSPNNIQTQIPCFESNPIDFFSLIWFIYLVHEKLASKIEIVRDGRPKEGFLALGMKDLQ